MKHIKLYEEFDWHSTASLVGKVFGYMGVGALLAKFCLNFFGNKSDKDFIRSSLKSSAFTMGDHFKFSIKDNIYKITTVEYGVDKDFFVIDRDKNEITYAGTSLDPIKTKLRKREIDQVISGIEFSIQIEDNVKSCFTEMEDEGYYVGIENINYMTKMFVVRLKSNKPISAARYDYDEVDSEVEMPFDLIKRCTRRLMSNMNLILAPLNPHEDLYEEIEDGYLVTLNEEDYSHVELTDLKVILMIK